MARESDEDLRGDLDAVLKAMVHGAFLPRDQIWLAADDICEQGEDPDALRAYASAELERLWTDQRALETSWHGRTDCDRLDQAFAELERVGIICRQDFTCCGTCGVAEIGMEFDEAEERGIKVRGYAFYHQQDTERAVEGDGIYLNYGADGEGDGPALAIGGEIMSALKRNGLKPRWNGKITQRIHVPLLWRRRLTCL